MSKGKATKYDVELGKKLIRRRQELQLTQVAVVTAFNEVGERLGIKPISTQQYGKYEYGLNRVTSTSMFIFAGLLGCEIEYFRPDFTVKTIAYEPYHDALMMLNKVLRKINSHSTIRIFLSLAQHILSRKNEGG